MSQTFNSTATTETVTGLTNGVQYNVSVAAITSVGTGPCGQGVEQPDLSRHGADHHLGRQHDLYGRHCGNLHRDHDRQLRRQRCRESGALPSGVTFTDNGDGTATLAGTPATGHRGHLHRSVSTPPTASVRTRTQTFTLTVDEAPSITSGDSATFSEGNAGSSTITTSGFPTAALSETGALPSGVTFTDNGDGTATLAGTPGANSRGSYPITINATNGVSPDASQSFTLTVNAAPAITSGSTTTFTEGDAGDLHRGVQRIARRPRCPRAGALPSGVTFTDNGDGTATLAGTPATGSQGTYPITITASNGVSPDATQDFALVVDGPPAITSGDATTFTVGSAGTFTVTTTGTPTAAISETGTLPSGVTLTDNGDGTATLAGTPAAGSGGSYPITITADNGITPAATQSFTLTVDEAAEHHERRLDDLHGRQCQHLHGDDGRFPDSGAERDWSAAEWRVLHRQR